MLVNIKEPQFLTYDELHAVLRNFARRLKKKQSELITWNSYSYQDKYLCTTNSMPNEVSVFNIRYNGLQYKFEFWLDYITVQIIDKFTLIYHDNKISHSPNTYELGMYYCNITIPENSVMDDLDDTTLFQYELMYGNAKSMLILKNILIALTTEPSLNVIGKSYKRK